MSLPNKSILNRYFYKIGGGIDINQNLHIFSHTKTPECDNSFSTKNNH